MNVVIAFAFMTLCAAIFGVSWILAGGVLYLVGLGLKIGFFALAVYLPIAMVRWMMGKDQ